MKRTETATRVAIIGMSYRLPGCTGQSAWPLLAEGRDAITTVDASRWALDSMHHPRRAEPGTSYTFRAGTIGDIAGFDAAFFGISPREAAQMDPQQRILLELAWEALENASLRPSKLRGSDCGVYVGLSSVDYSYRLAYDLAGIDSSSATGGTASIAANRISYFLDLHGPSMVIDTACSSSLVAFHQACRAVASGEAGCALVGGISLHVHPYGFVAFSKASMLSRTGACRVFDAAGDGYVRSEGGGVFVLKPLDAAIRDGNPVLAVVAGTGVNSAGHSQGLTVPNVHAQAALLTSVYQRANIHPEEIDYLEAHGTGTAVGDPLEARALGMALGRARPRSAPLLIGSVKSNLGHLEAASGVAGLVKSILCLRHRAIPPSIHLDDPNPNILFDDWNLRPVRETLTLHPSRRLVIGVNSFGFGGANAHAILESAPVAPSAIEPQGPQPAAIVVSGRSEAALRAAADAHAALLRSAAAPALRDVAYSSVHGRDWHSHRAIVSGSDRAEVAQALSAFARGEKARAVVAAKALQNPGGPVFVYSGNGSVWAGMGARLMAEDPVFAGAVEDVDDRLRAHGGPAIAAEMRAGVTAERLACTEVAQPLLFALQVGMTEMLRHQGLAPTDVTGHSVGEVGAAWACGALSLDEAAQVVMHRSRTQARTRGSGTMMAVGLAQDETLALADSLGLSGRVHVACLNSPRHVTVAGTVDAIATLEKALARRRAFHRRLDIEYPFHSPAMDPVRDDLVAALRGLRPSAARIPFHSTVTGDAIPGTLLNAGYWWNNVREPVRFEQAIRAIVRDRATVLVEIGPQPILRNYMTDCLRCESVEGRAIATMERGRDGAAAIRAGAHQATLAGCRADFTRMFPAAGRLVQLPTYPWQRERHWREATAEAYDLVDRRREHPLLGYRLHENAFEWENHLDTALFPMLRDHALGGAVVFPGSAFVEMALAASRRVHGGDAHEIESLDIRAPLLLEESASRTVRFAYDPADGRFTVRSRPRLSGDAWLLHVTGKLCGAPFGAPTAGRNALPARQPDLTGADHYELAERVGLAYGPAFRSVVRTWLDDDTVGAIARLVLPDAARADAASFLLHPASLDGAFQLLVDLLRAQMPVEGGVAFVPVQVERAKVYRVAPAHSARARLATRTKRSIVADFALFDAQGEPVAELHRVRFRSVVLKTSASARLRKLVHRAVPRPLESDRAVAPAATLGALAQAFASRMHGLSHAGPRARYYAETEPLCEMLCAAFAERAVRQLAGPSAIQPEALAARLPAERVPLLHRLLAILEEDGLIEPGEDGWRWSAPSDLPDAHEGWITLVRDYPDEAAQLVALGLAGMRLPQTLSDGLAAPASDLTRADAVLSSGAWVAHCGRALAELAGAWIERTPRERPLRILELAAMYSGIAARVLESVEPDRCEYAVGCASTDVLAEFEHLREAERTLEAFAFDIEEARRRGPFDLVVATDGLQGWQDADAVLAQAADLVAQGGVLALFAQHPSRSADIMHGSDPAWWRQAPDGTRRTRLRSPGEWEARLRERGFDSVCVVPEVEHAQRGCFALFAQLDRASELARPPREPKAWLLLHEESSHAAALAAGVQSRLRELGDSACTMTCGAAQPEALLHAAREELGALDAVVHLSGFPSREAAAGADSSQLAQRCQHLTHVIEACRMQPAAPDAWVVMARAAGGLVENPPGDSPSRPDPDAALAWGFARSLANEYPELALRRIDCADIDNLETLTMRLAAELACASDDDEVILARGGRYALRLAEVRKPRDAEAGARLDFAMPGSLRNLGWTREERRTPAAHEVEIEVRAAGLNFRDVMYAMGLLSDEAVENGFAGPTLGMEFSGVVTAVGAQVTDFSRGDEVLGFAPASFATHIVTEATAIARKPAQWSFEAAATVPAAYFTALYALDHLARLREGESVLVHGAAGGVGIAAIRLARSLGARVFATAGNADKRALVGLLGADHVLDSRSLAFADEIMRITEGRGVDVVLNSLSGEALVRSLRVLRPFGRFLELGKRDFYENTAVGLRPFRNNISYFGIDADQLLREKPALARSLFTEMMSLVADEVIVPLPYRSFSASDAVDAFRHMQQSRHAGKIVLDFGDGLRAPLATQRAEFSVREHATYLVTGGTDGFGLKTALWLAARGARNLVLVSRSGTGSLAAKAAVADLEALGATVHVVACDVSDRGAVQRMLARIAATMPPLRGVVHAAAVIDDALARNLSTDRIARVLAPKAIGARHLDELTRVNELDFFVMYSSATTVFGNPGQASYVAANCHLEALARSRRSQGLPATCIGWGAIGDVGYLARNKGVKEALSAHLGAAPLESDTALEMLGAALAAGESGQAILEFSWRNLKRFLPTAGSARLRELGSQGDDARGDADHVQELRQLARKVGAEELAALVGGILRRELAEILRMPQERVDPRQPLQEIGLDSLMGVELLTAIESQFGVNLQVMALAEGPSLDSLAERIARELKGGESHEGARPGHLDQVAARYARDLDAARIDELASEIGPASGTAENRL